MTTKADISNATPRSASAIRSWLPREGLNRLAGVRSRFGPPVARIHIISYDCCVYDYDDAANEMRPLLLENRHHGDARELETAIQIKSRT